jgi:abequosyltransferase
MSAIDDSIVLSISIPTFNRAPLLKRCLESLFVLNKAKDLPIEVSVYNNGSADNTDEVVRAFIADGYPIRYTHVSPAINGNLNIYQCYQKARGRYVLCLGDDDAFVANTLDKIVQYLSTADIGVFYLSTHNINTNTYQVPFTGTLRCKTYTEAESFVRASNIMVTFISANIIRNPQLADDAPPADDYLNFYQVPLILGQIFARPTNVVII